VHILSFKYAEGYRPVRAGVKWVGVASGKMNSEGGEPALARVKAFQIGFGWRGKLFDRYCRSTFFSGDSF
jgi:hypothetical protein